MPQTIQHIYGKRLRRRYCPAEGAIMTQEEMWAFFAAYEGLGRAEGTVRFYRRRIQRLYQTTRGVIENNIALLVEQAMERMLEQEQFSVGWEEK